MLLGVFLLACSAAFVFAVPATDSATNSEINSSPAPLVSNWEHKSHSETNIELKEVNSKNVSDLFIQTPGNKFYVSNVAKTWDDAAKSCESVGMALASITSQKEQIELVRFLFKNDLVPVDDLSGYWLSGQQLENGLYNWIALNKYMNCWGWLPGEPSHFDDLEHCVELKLELKKVQFGWNNLFCGKDRRFICQKKIVSNKDTSLNQSKEQYQETNEEFQTNCYFLYSPRVPHRHISREEDEGFVRFG